MLAIPKELGLLGQDILKLCLFDMRIRVIPSQLIEECPKLKKLTLEYNQIEPVIPPVVQEFFRQDGRSIVQIRSSRLGAILLKSAFALGCFVIGTVVSAVLYRIIKV